MSPNEADAQWVIQKATRMKAKLMDLLLALPLDRKKHWIRQAMAYRSGPDSCNSVYMGSMLTCRLITELGGEYGRSSLESLLERATDSQVDKALHACAAVLSYMQRTITID